MEGVYERSYGREFGIAPKLGFQVIEHKIRAGLNGMLWRFPHPGPAPWKRCRCWILSPRIHRMFCYACRINSIVLPPNHHRS